MKVTVNELKELILETVQEILEEKKNLKGKQEKLDVNKDGKLDKKDFAELGRRSKVVAKAAKGEKDKKTKKEED